MRVQCQERVKREQKDYEHQNNGEHYPIRHRGPFMPGLQRTGLVKVAKVRRD